MSGTCLCRRAGRASFWIRYSTAAAGSWVFHWMRNTLDRIESAHYDCFPSGHVELTILAWWSSRQISQSCAGHIWCTLLCIIFATVYLRYHYTVDLLAGALFAAALIVTAPALYRRWGGDGSSAGRVKKSEGPLALEVVAAESKPALKEFVEFPYSLYRGDPNWVPPLRIAVKELMDRKKHPFYANAEAEFFLAQARRPSGGPDRRHPRPQPQ